MTKKGTKRALLTSVLAVFMCVTMLIGTTFAWFTDTATTAVNKIQSGTLDVELYYADNTTGEEATWTKITKETAALQFVKAEVGEGQEILWEPGCTYSLPALKIKNEGNLALKYKVLFSAVNTDEENLVLAKVLDVTMNGNAAGTLYDVLTSTDADGYAHGNLAGKAETEAITLQVKMSEKAGKDYQNLTIGGIAITVVATQDMVEYDSYGNEYDKQAVYPVIDSTGLSAAVTQNNAVVAMAEGEFTLSSGNNTSSVSITADNLTISGEGSGETVLKQDGSQYYKFSGDNTTLKNITIDAGSRTGGNYIAVYLAGDNATLDGVTVKNAKSDNTRGTNAVDVEVAAGTTCKITNCDISGEGYLITTSSSSSGRKLNGTLLIEDTKLSPTNGNGYSLYSISGSGKLIANRSDITGRNSIDVDAVFTDCTFKKINGYSFVTNKKNTTFVNCTFETGFWFQGTEQTTVTFENCYYNGELITNDNLSSFKGLIAGNNENLEVVVN